MLYFIGDCFSPGSPGNNRFDGLCQAIVQQGYDVTRVFIRPNEERLKAEDNSGIQYRYLWNGKNLSSGKWRHVQQIKWIVSFLRSVSQQDKLVVTNSDYLFVYSFFPKLHIYHEKSEYPELNIARASLPLRWVHKAYLSTCRKIDGVFPISFALKNYFIEKGISSEKIQVVNMTVDPSRFTNVKKQQVQDRYFAYCGSVSNYKDGVDILIKAFAIVARKIPSIKLFIIGDFPFKRDKEEDIALVISLGLADRVIFTGPVPRDEMPQILKNADALVLARPDNIQAKYGFPTKLGEYLLTGNPVVLTNVGDIPMFLKDGVDAYIAEPGSVEEIASKMLAAVTSPNSMIIGRNGLAVAMREFNCLIESKKIVDFIYGKQ